VCVVSVLAVVCLSVVGASVLSVVGASVGGGECVCRSRIRQSTPAIGRSTASRYDSGTGGYTGALTVSDRIHYRPDVQTDGRYTKQACVCAGLSVSLLSAFLQRFAVTDGVTVVLRRLGTHDSNDSAAHNKTKEKQTSHGADAPVIRWLAQQMHQ